MKESVFLKKILFVFVIFLFGIPKVNAASNPYKQMQTIDGLTYTRCTWFAWKQAYENAGVALPGWGNAVTWYNSAKNAGYSVGSEAKANSIAVWRHTNNSFGHVAYVVSVNGDYMNVNEGGIYTYETNEAGEEVKVAYNGNGIVYNATVPSKGNRSSTTSLVGFIYLDDAPKTPKSNATSSPTTTTPKKSNNANLSSIKISNVKFEFKKDTLEYDLVVENAIENINVEATTENNKAKVEGIGEHQLDIGANTIKLVVTAEDNTKKTYTIKIKRKDNNAYLSSLVLSDIDFEFTKETFEYEIEIARDIENITIEGTLESETSTIEGLGEYPLYEEETIINLTVTAEDETQNIYTLKIKKEPQVEENNSQQKLNIWLIIGSVLAFCIVMGSIVIVIIKKKRKKK